jgi:hypothetical protein
MLINKQNTLLKIFFSFKTNLSGIGIFTLVVETKDNASLSKYRVSVNDCRVQPAMETCQILNVPLCSANDECHIFRLGCWLLTSDVEIE